MCSSESMTDYLRERFPITRFGALAVFLAAAGLAASPPAHPWRWAVAAAQSLSLILQFRLWDDIADREHDRVVHPERVLSRTADMRPFLVLAAALFVGNGLILAWLQPHGGGPVTYLALCAGLLAWYRLRPAVLHRGLLNTHLVLLKYPVIAWLIGVPMHHADAVLVLSCLFSVYLIFVVFDMFDDDELCHLPGAIPSLAVALGLLVGVWILITLRSRPHAGPLPWLVWSVIAVASLALGLAGLSKRRRRTAFRGGNGFFIIGLLAYLALAAEMSL
jgi:uncharacterized membrane protein SirB2